MKRGHRAQYRPCTLDTKLLEEIAGWVDHYRPAWDARFNRMEDYLQQIQSTRKDNAYD